MGQSDKEEIKKRLSGIEDSRHQSYVKYSFTDTKCAKIFSKTLISTGSEFNFAQNPFFCDAAEGLITAVLLPTAEYLNDTDCCKRHIVSVFKLVRELLEPFDTKGKSCFQLLMELLPPNHKARWDLPCVALAQGRMTRGAKKAGSALQLQHGPHDMDFR